MPQLLDGIANKINKEAIEKLTGNNESFQVKAGIFQEKPLLIKIGTKEGIHRDQRFYAYEKVQKKDGTQVKRKRGIVRVYKPENNSGVASGSTTPSKFYQVGGTKLYQGMFVEEKKDKGISFGMGYVAGGYKPLSGLAMAAEINLSLLLGMGNGIHFGVVLTGHGGSNVEAGNIFSGSKQLTSDTSLYKKVGSGSTVLVLYRDCYFGTGNIYLSPLIGYGWVGITIDSSSVVKYDNNYSKEAYDWNSKVFQFGLGIGFNVFPRVSMVFKPSLSFVPAYKDGNKILLNQKKTSSFADSGFGFDKIDAGAMRPSMYMGLRIRI